MNAPVPTASDRSSLATFHALLEALSRPGRRVPWPAPLPGDIVDAIIMARVGDALLDTETTFYTLDPRLRERFQNLGAAAAPIPNAEFIFADAAESKLTLVASEASVGSWMAPEDGASLVIAAPFDGTLAAVLRGPGIQGERRLALPRIPRAFWEVRNRRIAYPLGWDLFLVEERGIIGIPRTTDVRLE